MNNIQIEEFIKNIKRVNCDKVHLPSPAFMHAVIGIADEAGELMEILKRAMYYGDAIDDDHVIEEHGDLMFYIIRDCMRIAEKRGVNTQCIFQAVLDRNDAKLKARYPDGFSEGKATESGRDRVAERKAMTLPSHPVSRAKPQRDHPKDPSLKPTVFEDKNMEKSRGMGEQYEDPDMKRDKKAPENDKCPSEE